MCQVDLLGFFSQQISSYFAMMVRPSQVGRSLNLFRCSHLIAKRGHVNLSLVKSAKINHPVKGFPALNVLWYQGSRSKDSSERRDMAFPSPISMKRHSVLLIDRSRHIRNARALPKRNLSTPRWRIGSPLEVQFSE